MRTGINTGDLPQAGENAVYAGSDLDMDFFLRHAATWRANVYNSFKKGQRAALYPKIKFLNFFI